MTALDRDGPSSQRAVYRHNWSLLSFLVLVFAGVLFLGSQAVLSAPSLPLVLGGLFLTGLGIIALYILGEQIRTPAPLLLIDTEGIWDRRISGAPLPWTAIKRVYVQQIGLYAFSRSLRMELREPESFQPPRYGALRLLSYRKDRSTLLQINTALLNVSADDVLAEIKHFRPAVVSLPPGPLDPEYSVSPEVAGGYAGPSEAVTFFRNKKKLALPFLCCLAVMLLGAVCLLDSTLHRIEGGVLLVVSTLFALWLGHEALTAKAPLIVSRQGIHLRDFGSRTIPWSDVRDVKVSEWLIAVEAPPLPEAPRWSPIARILSALRSDGPPMIITIGLDARIDEIRATIAHFRAQAASSGPSSSGR